MTGLQGISFSFPGWHGRTAGGAWLKAGKLSGAHARMIEYLSTKEGVELVASHMDQALHQLETGEKKLRFRSVMPKEELRRNLTIC